ncbi:MAG TPA: hypothetical protein VFW47_05220 [Phenylobacterium sp.]|nr:hypothetical protein [Phenylobacterium sp.]
MGEICEALLRFGGSAHRDRVLDCLVANRSGLADLRLRARAMAVFDAHSGMDRLGAPARPLFRKPFGPGKLRWALTPEAEAFLRAGVATRARLRGVSLDS